MKFLLNGGDVKAAEEKKPPRICGGAAIFMPYMYGQMYSSTNERWEQAKSWSSTLNF
jgi:hypothetical protein